MPLAASRLGVNVGHCKLSHQLRKHNTNGEKNTKTKRFYFFTPPLAKFCCVTQACGGENVQNIQT